MHLPHRVRAALAPASRLAKRFRRFLDAEALHRDHSQNHTLVTGLGELRSELSSLATEQEVSAHGIEALTLTVAQLQAEILRLRSSLASLPVAMLAARAQSADLGASLASAYAIQALAALPLGAAVLDVGEDPHQISWSLATLGYAVTALGVKGQLAARPGVELHATGLAAWQPGARKFDGLVSLRGEAAASAASLKRLRQLARPEALLVLAVPLEAANTALDEQRLSERLAGWSLDDYTVAERRSGSTKASAKGPRAAKQSTAQRVALITARAV